MFIWVVAVIHLHHGFTGAPSSVASPSYLSIYHKGEVQTAENETNEHRLYIIVIDMMRYWMHVCLGCSPRRTDNQKDELIRGGVVIRTNQVLHD